jgi:hypothetical protein
VMEDMVVDVQLSAEEVIAKQAKEIDALRGEQDHWYKRYRELGDRYVEQKKALEILQCFKEIDSCAVPVEEYQRLEGKWDSLVEERKRELELVQAPFETIIDCICCELLCPMCFAKTLHVAGSEVMMGRLMKYYSGKYANTVASHKQITASSEKHAELMLIMLQQRVEKEYILREEVRKMRDALMRFVDNQPPYPVVPTESACVVTPLKEKIVEVFKDV